MSASEVKQLLSMKLLVVVPIIVAILAAGSNVHEKYIEQAGAAIRVVHLQKTTLRGTVEILWQVLEKYGHYLSAVVVNTCHPDNL